MRPFLLLLPLLLMLTTAPAQDWVRMMQDPTVNFYDVQKAFYKYMEKMERKKKKNNGPQSHEAEIPGYTMFKRWEWFMAPRVYPTGDRSNLLRSGEEMFNYYNNLRVNPSVQQAGAWSLLGPVNTIPSNGGGCGRLNCVRIDPNNPNTIYVGAPAGGLWKSTNGGLSWITTTDQLASIGVSDVAIDPTNSNIVYIATGDNDAGDTYTIGVLKSIDGGLTWNSTGLTFNIVNTGRVTRLLIHPTSPNILYAATGQGVYKTTDSGLSWTKIFGASTKDMEFKPGDPNSIYICTTTTFYKSSNGGINFYSVGNGMPPSTSCSRLAIGVTENDPNYVYVLASKQSGYGYLGVYRSTNSGNSFTQQSNSPNLLGWEANGSDGDGQGWYTLSIDVSPTNKDEVVVGGVNIWKSGDGAVNWNLEAHWWGNGAPYVHADIHDLFYVGANSYYVASDGGLAFTNNGGATFTDLSAGLQIAQMYRLGNSVTNPNLVVSGWQDNGTNSWSSGTWDHIYGGDGMECFVDYSNAQNIYAETQYGGLVASYDGGNTFTQLTGFTTESAEWVTPWCQDPIVPNTLYVGYENVWKSTDQGSTWNPISNFGAAGITILQIAPSNNQIIYAGNFASMQKTTDGGNTWTDITSLLPSAAFLSGFAIHATDPNKLWISFQGYNTNVKVFRSTDGGNTWANLASNTLPNVPVNCIVSQTGTNDGVYAGTDNGVYYYDETIQNWSFFSNGLPNVIIDEMEIHYGTGKLRAATFGRGLWETDLYNPASTSPLANFSASALSGCVGVNITFTDLSTNSPTGWNWTFPGGVPATSTAQNPIVTYNNPGSLNDVKLVATNANGSDSTTRYSYIKISALVTPTIMLTSNDTVCDNQPLLLIASSGSSFNWSPYGQGTYLISPNFSNTYAVTVTDIYGCTGTSAPVDITILPVPATPIIGLNGNTLCSDQFTGNQWYFNGVPINGATSQCYLLTQPGNYYAVITGSNGCTAASNVLVGFGEDMNELFFSLLTPNPATDLVNYHVTLPSASWLELEMMDISGRVVYTTRIENENAAFEGSLDLRSMTAGAYVVVFRTSLGQANKTLIIKE